MHEVVFDGVSWPHDFGALATDDGPNQLGLDFVRHGGRATVDVNLVGFDTLGFEKYLMRLFLREPNDLVLDGRAIPRSDPFDPTRIEWRPMQVGADDIGCSLGRPR